MNDAKKITIALFIFFFCIISMIGVNTYQIISLNKKVDYGIAKNDGLYFQAFRDHKSLMFNQRKIIKKDSIIIDNQDTVKKQHKEFIKILTRKP